MRAWNRIGEIVPEDSYRRTLDRAVERVAEFCKGKRAAYAWSGGKDSIALAEVCERAGVVDCCFGMTDHLEYPAFLQWVTDWMPERLTVIKNGWDMDWLADHQEMIFPQTATVAAKWFAGIQHRAQAEYFAAESLDIICLGRRTADGNHIGPKGADHYESRGVLRFSPIADWTHEQTLACMYWEGWGDRLPPFYSWPRGYRCGTHAWPARQWCKSTMHGWHEIHRIDPSIVVMASERIDSAKRYLDMRK